MLHVYEEVLNMLWGKHDFLITNVNKWRPPWQLRQLNERRNNKAHRPDRVLSSAVGVGILQLTDHGVFWIDTTWLSKHYKREFRAIKT